MVKRAGGKPPPPYVHSEILKLFFFLLSTNSSKNEPVGKSLPRGVWRIFFFFLSSFAEGLEVLGIHPEGGGGEGRRVVHSQIHSRRAFRFHFIAVRFPQITFEPTCRGRIWDGPLNFRFRKCPEVTEGDVPSANKEG